MLAEHRLERVVPFADRVALVPGGGDPLVVGPTAEVMKGAPVAPPIVELGRAAGWSPLPLSVRDARRLAGPLIRRLRAAPHSLTPAAGGPPVAVAEVERLAVTFGEVAALRGVSLSLAAGEIVAVMGRNGSGKSTLLGQLAGLRQPTRGQVRVMAQPPTDVPARRLIRMVGLVPQEPGLLLYGESVGEECRAADRETGLEPGETAAALEGIVGGLDPERHPRDLSEGQRLALALAVVLAPRPRLILLDEPTRGLDYPGKERLVAIVRRLAAEGACVVMATHDVELVAKVAGRAVVLAEGEVVADGRARDVVCHSPVFAPQVAKILAPEPWLTVEEVVGALGRADHG